MQYLYIDSTVQYFMIMTHCVCCNLSFLCIFLSVDVIIMYRSSILSVWSENNIFFEIITFILRQRFVYQHRNQLWNDTTCIEKLCNVFVIFQLHRTIWINALRHRIRVVVFLLFLVNFSTALDKNIFRLYYLNLKLCFMYIYYYLSCKKVPTV